MFSDNVIPSLLVHLGVLDLSTSTSSVGLVSLFPGAGTPETLEALLAIAPSAEAKGAKKGIPVEGPLLTPDQAFTLRAAAIDACELIVEFAHGLSDDELKSSGGKDVAWLKTITLPELDAWIWAVAKDRADYRKLERFAQRGTAFF